MTFGRPRSTLGILLARLAFPGLFSHPSGTGRDIGRTFTTGPSKEGPQFRVGRNNTLTGEVTDAPTSPSARHQYIYPTDHQYSPGGYAHDPSDRLDNRIENSVHNTFDSISSQVIGGTTASIKTVLWSLQNTQDRPIGSE